MRPAPKRSDFSLLIVVIFFTMSLATVPGLYQGFSRIDQGYKMDFLLDLASYETAAATLLALIVAALLRWYPAVKSVQLATRLLMIAAKAVQYIPFVSVVIGKAEAAVKQWKRRRGSKRT